MAKKTHEDLETRYFERLEKINPILRNKIIGVVGSMNKEREYTYFKTIYGILKIKFEDLKRNKDLGIRSAISKTNFWKLKAVKILNKTNRVDYSMVLYKGNKNKINLRCKIHNNNYYQTPAHHMEGIEGCIYCSKKIIRYTKENILNNSEFFKYKKCFVYVIQLSNRKESFFKIGISSEDKFRFRKAYFSNFYNIEEKYKELKSTKKAYKIEQWFLKTFSNYKYIPSIKFGGYTECLTINPIDEIMGYENYK